MTECLLPQVAISLVQPVLAWRIEDVASSVSSTPDAYAVAIEFREEQLAQRYAKARKSGAQTQTVANQKYFARGMTKQNPERNFFGIV